MAGEAKPAPAPSPVLGESRQGRLDRYALHMAAAIVSRQGGRTPIALAREAVDLAAALITEVDKKLSQ